MKILVYTCVFGGYDRVFPPVAIEPEVEYLVLTDDASLKVEGWDVRFVDTSAFRSPQAANRHFKMLGHRWPVPHDASVYVDGNVRILGPVSPLVHEFMESGAALGVYPHQRRGSVADEVAACIASRKVADPQRAADELASYRAEGFPDSDGLVEATILLKNHQHPELDAAMALWWSLFDRHGNRDQFSLPYVLWKTGLPCHWQPRSFRDANPYFGIYPHFAAPEVPTFYAVLSARAFDSRFHRWCRDAWHLKWRLQRFMRQMSRPGRRDGSPKPAGPHNR